MLWTYRLRHRNPTGSEDRRAPLRQKSAANAGTLGNATTNTTPAWPSPIRSYRARIVQPALRGLDESEDRAGVRLWRMQEQSVRCRPSSSGWMRRARRLLRREYICLACLSEDGTHAQLS